MGQAVDDARGGAASALSAQRAAAASLRSRLQRRVVAEAVVAPGVVVDGGHDLEAEAKMWSRRQPPPWRQTQLGSFARSRARRGRRRRSRARAGRGRPRARRCPSARRARAAGARACRARRRHRAVGLLAARRVEVAAEDARAVGPAARPARSAASVSGLTQPLAAFGTWTVCTTTPSTRAASVVSGHGTGERFGGARAARGRRARTPVRRRLIGWRAGSASSSEHAACGRPIVSSAARHSGHERAVTSCSATTSGSRRPAPPPARRAR